MGRGLSDLQRRILRLVAARAESPEATPRSYLNGTPTPVVRQSEILAVCYGLPLARRYEKEASPFHGQNFDRAAIGHKRYATARAGVSRAIGRLKARGLVIRCTSVYNRCSAGIALTEVGKAMAAELAPRGYCPAGQTTGRSAGGRSN
jgi:hypothetical protein